jgi:hypothetical protein
MSNPEDDYLTDREQAAGALLISGVTALERNDREAVEAVAYGVVDLEARDLFMAGIFLLRDALRAVAHGYRTDTSVALEKLGLHHAGRPTRADDGLD